MQPETLALVARGNAKKGDVLGTARIAGIMAAKRTHELIPLCHPLALTKVAVDLEPDADLPGVARAGDRQGHGPDRRRDGGADRRLGRLPHRLRHGQGGRPRHADRGHPPRREARRQVRRLRRRADGGRDASARPMLPVAEALRAHPGRPPRAPLRERERAAAPRRAAARWRATSPRCARSRPSPSRPWTATRCAPPTSPRRRRRCASSARARPAAAFAGARRRRARRCASSPARRCPPAPTRS